MSNGFLVLGDVHNEHAILTKAVDYSIEKNLRLIFVGDLVDYGPSPKETIELAHDCLKNHDAIFIEGNHDNKIARYLKGNNVQVVLAMQDTVNVLETNEQTKSQFEDLYSSMISYLKINDTYITHGGIHKNFWAGDIESNAVKSVFLYGETDLDSSFIEYNGQQYPHRKYTWTEHIPNNHIVIVGHDRSPFEEIPLFESETNQIVIRKNNLGGEVIFIDTGAGKGGFISGVVLDLDGNVQDMISF